MMSAKIIKIATLASVVLVAAVWLHHNIAVPSSRASDNNSEQDPTLERTNTITPSALTLQSPDSPGPDPSTSVGTESESPQEKHEAYVNERIAQLADLGLENDADSLQTILSELANRDPAIRKAALDAAIQFGSRDAIPAIHDAISRVDDPEEKAALAKAIDFLHLTNITDVNQLSSER